MHGGLSNISDSVYSRLHFIRTLWSRLFLSDLSEEISLSELTRDMWLGTNTPIFAIYTVKV